MNKIQISVIIANRNGASFLSDCLTSLYSEQSDAFEVIVIDDASTDNSVEILQRFKHHKRLHLVTETSQIGAAEARNKGVALSQGSYVFFLDSDTTVERPWVSPILTFFAENTACGMAQVKLLRKNSSTYDYAGDFVSPFGFLVDRARTAQDTGQFDNIVPIFSGKSAALIAKKSVVLQVGGFDRDYMIFLEDTDIMWRTWLAGYTVLFFPGVTVYHAYGTKDKSFDFYIKNKVHYRGSKNTILTHTKNWGMGRLLFVLPIQLATWTILGTLFLLKGDRIKGTALLTGIRDALREMPRTIQKRKHVQQTRKISDHDLFKTVGIHQSASYYFGKAKSYILGHAY